MFEILESYPLLLLTLLVVVGSLLGQIKIAGATLGPAAVLFTAIGLTAWGVSNGVELTIPEVLGSFGLIIFTYTVGIISGPNFFGSLRRGWPVMLSTVACLALAALVAGGLGRILGLPNPLIAGTFAGALNNTPSLAAASQAAGDAELPAVGYSISYLWGVIGMMLAAAWAIQMGNRESKSATAPPLEQRTIRVDDDSDLTVAELLEHSPGSVTVSRVQHENEPTVVAAPDERLHKGDLVSVIGPHDALAAVTGKLGHASSVDIISDRTYLDSVRATLSSAKLAGRRIDELGLAEQFGAHVSRVRRGDVDMIASPDFVVQMGDRPRVVAPRDQLAPLRAHLGDSERGFSDINPSGLALGLVIGIVIGIIPIPLPTGSFTLGLAAGTLLTGLVFGRLGHIGRLPVSMPSAAANSLSALGMLVFLAYAGMKAGLQFGAAMTSNLGWKAAVLGFAITTTTAVAFLVAGRLHKTGWIQLAGQLGGGHTQPAVLAFANTRTGFDTRVSLGYALVYPTAMVAKILLAQMLVLVG